MIRPKPFLTYFFLCAIPLLLFAGLNYWNGVRTVNSTINAIAQDDLNSFNFAVDEIISDRKNALLGFALTSDVRQAVADQSQSYPLVNLDGYFQNVTLFDRDRRPLSGNTRLAHLQADPQVWGLQGNTLLERPGSTPGTVELSAPIHDENGKTNGALVGVLNLDVVFSNAWRGLRSNKDAMVVVLDRSGKLVYHPDPRLKDRFVSEALPEFASIANPMAANPSGL